MNRKCTFTCACMHWPKDLGETLVTAIKSYIWSKKEILMLCMESNRVRPYTTIVIVHWNNNNNIIVYSSPPIKIP